MCGNPVNLVGEMVEGGKTCRGTRFHELFSSDFYWENTGRIEHTAGLYLASKMDVCFEGGASQRKRPAAR